jgi:uncharacterized protein
VARSTYALPYMWSDMAVERDGSILSYRSRRRWPSPTPAFSRIMIEVGAPLHAGQLSELDHYLTARWQLYTTLGPLLARSNVEHEPWPLHRATVRALETNLLTAAGLPSSDEEPLAHWSPGVHTRISALRPLSRGGSEPARR